MNLVPLQANQPPDRFYRGGAAIDAFRGSARGADRRPEDWVGSTTTLSSETRLGLTTLPGGELLRDAVAANPEEWLGTAHLEAFGPETRLLVKLLDAGQRLPVHAHPSDEFAVRHLHLPNGKAEAWFILSGGSVYAGLREHVSREALRALVDNQDTEGMLGLLHERRVEPGELVYIPPGVLHAIGAGVLLLELQQPADLSILLEWRDFELDGRADGHIGLGFDRALEAVEHDPRPIDELIITVAEGEAVLPDGGDAYFRLERVPVADDEAKTVDAGFAVVVVESGAIFIEPEFGEPVRFTAGSTLLAPHGAGPLTIRGDGTVLLARPPRPMRANS
ncbi:MAG: hypothetical protein BGN97_12665 [Microbacterium sp. 69-10]|nr:MAG: hypothetical protein BGN97_12665 [Microbacterium sp. 69-10]